MTKHYEGVRIKENEMAGTYNILVENAEEEITWET
jgi:hypothetical protein